LFLLSTEAREGALRAGPASRTKLFAALRRIVIRDLLDPFELLHQTGLRNLDSRLGHAAVQQRDQRHGQNAGKGMDAKHLVGPMTGRGEANAVDRKSTRLNSSHVSISYAVFCLKKKTKTKT